MSTHCTLGVRMSDGTIRGTYVHYDGYEEHMIPAIQSYVKEKTTTGLYVLIMKAASVGGMRSFHSPQDVDSENVTTELFQEPWKPYLITEKDWHEDHCNYAWYLVDYTTGKIDIRKKEYGRID